MNSTTFLTASLVSLFGGSAFAAPVAIVNHDFEDDVNATHISSTGPSGWVSDNTSDGVWRPGAFSSYTNLTSSTDVTGTMDGSQAAFMSSNAAGSYSQTLAATLQANTTYTLSVAFGNRTQASRDASPVTISVFAGTTLIATASGDPDSFVTEPDFGDLVAVGSTGVSPADLGTALTIVIAQDAVTGGTMYMDVDNVRLDASPVPEPGSLALLGLGGLLFARRRRG